MSQALRAQLDPVTAGSPLEDRFALRDGRALAAFRGAPGVAETRAVLPARVAV